MTALAELDKKVTLPHINWLPKERSVIGLRFQSRTASIRTYKAHEPMKKTLFTLAILSAITAQSQAALIFGGDFQMYKTGTGYTVTAEFSGTNPFARGVGNAIDIAGGIVTYSDLSPDGVANDAIADIDLPGWMPLQSGNDLANNGVGGSTGMNIFAAWGGDGRIQTAGSLGVIGAGQTITISVMAGGPSGGPIGGPLAFHLMAGATQLVPTSFVDPVLLNGSFEMMSRTYDAAALAGSIGQNMSIVLGVEDANNFGNRVIFDNVDLTVVPEPSSALLLSLGGMALALRRTRKK